MTLRHSALTATAVAAAIMLTPVVSMAQGSLCLELEARLVQIERGGDVAGAPGGSRRYDAPIAQQRNEIDRAMAEARRAGCTGGFLIFQRRAEPKCPQLMATIDQMRGNLQRLMRARAASGNDPAGMVQERNNIMRSLAMNGCGPGNRDGLQQPQGGGLFALLFGQPTMQNFGDRGFGTYRTLCVRTCDGYYFPISFSTLPAQFNDDALTCQQMCPGAEAVLYTHRNPGEDTAQMVSLSGEPYTALPNAFRYRQTFDRACTCHAAATAALGASLIDLGVVGASTAPMSMALPSAPAAPMPRLRSAAVGEDPETAANRAGGLVPKAIAPPPQDLVAEGPDGKRIRIVGPAYFYAE